MYYDVTMQEGAALRRGSGSRHSVASRLFRGCEVLPCDGVVRSGRGRGAALRDPDDSEADARQQWHEEGQREVEQDV